MKTSLFLFAMLLLLLPVSASAGEVVPLPLIGIKASTPQKATFSAGVLLGTSEKKDHAALFEGFTAQVEPGLAGLKTAIGYGFGHPVLYMGAVRASYLRTWGDPVGASPGQDYIGVDIENTLMLLNLSFGVYRHVRGDGDEDNWLVSLGFGISPTL